MEAVERSWPSALGQRCSIVACAKVHASTLGLVFFAALGDDAVENKTHANTIEIDLRKFFKSKPIELVALDEIQQALMLARPFNYS